MFRDFFGDFRGPEFPGSDKLIRDSCWAELKRSAHVCVGNFLPHFVPWVAKIASWEAGLPWFLLGVIVSLVVVQGASRVHV